MFENVTGFFERYGWYTLLGAAAFFLIYQKFLYERVQTMYADRELMQQKKYDEDQQQLNRERMEKAREKMQAEYNKEVEHRQELERIKAQQRRNQKLGIGEEEMNPNLAQPPRFDALQYVRDQIASKPVLIFSKSWCPFSRKAKQILIGNYRIEPQFYKVIELDEMENNADLIQDVLQRLTGGRSVPRVFIGGKFIGGGDDTERLHRENNIAPMLRTANVKFYE